eukprot:2990386-Pleurochrysis_carterae.AAC.1
MTCGTTRSTASWDRHSATSVCTGPLGFQQPFEGGGQLLAPAYMSKQIDYGEQGKQATCVHACAAHVLRMSATCDSDARILALPSAHSRSTRLASSPVREQREEETAKASRSLLQFCQSQRVKTMRTVLGY